MEQEDRVQNVSEDYLMSADISNNVVTLQQLQQRRQELIAKKTKILENIHSRSTSEVNPIVQLVRAPQADVDPASTANFNTLSNVRFNEQCATLNASTPILDPIITTSNSGLISILANETDLDFRYDDAIAGPSYVPLSDITNVEPIGRASVDWFPERDTEPEAASTSRIRKRKADAKTWKSNINKKNRMLGKEYVGFKKIYNKYVRNANKPKRMMGQKCNSKLCQKSKTIFCSKICEEERREIFQKFWSMSWREKKVFVLAMVDKKRVNRKTVEDTSRRTFSKVYRLQVNGQKLRVCLKTFLSTLGIKEWTVRYWLGDNIETNIEQTTINTPRTAEKRQAVKNFLVALPKIPSHYCRKSSTKQYLEPNIQSKAELYRIYVQSKPETVASIKLFNDILEEENIGLFQPKKDACDFCSSYKVGNVEEEAYQKHVKNKNMAREEKTRDKENAKLKSIHVITADLQAVKLCPSLNASALYFKTKLTVHNFTLYNLGTDEVCCYWFDETACDLKAPTYASFFVDYLTKLLDKEPKNVVIWSDGCTAQNRNCVLANALLLLAMQKNVTITQKYLEKGHTQMEVDSVHSVIERKLKNVEIFLPSQYASITKEARRRPFPYTVEQPDHTFFKDYSAKQFQIYDSIRPGRGVGDGCVVDLRVLKYNPNGTIEYKNQFQADFSPLPRRPKTVTSSIIDVPPLYASRLPIQETKYDHLQQLKSVIPHDCHAFYDNIPYKKK